MCRVSAALELISSSFESSYKQFAANMKGGIHGLFLVYLSKAHSGIQII